MLSVVKIGIVKNLLSILVENFAIRPLQMLKSRNFLLHLCKEGKLFQEAKKKEHRRAVRKLVVFLENPAIIY
ncbi:hypothetical protein VNO78_19436 [Psophocarpus tetragonolobus]|uniref:Uncharacterized protein n=1 Tax=Psophocarpus tetragonolobus TaxID=3891 RepID=A0AAN9S7K7_PSOTE